VRFALFATAVFAVMTAGWAQAATESACPGDPLAPANNPVVQLDAYPTPDGLAASFGSLQYRRLPGLGPKDIALTFDDGPNPTTTPKVLRVLAQHCIKATFFLVGSYAAARPDLVRAEAAAGHVIGSHTWSHPDNLRRLDQAAAEREIVRGFRAVQDSLSGAPETDRAQLAPFFRFPGLNDNRVLREWLGQRQIAVIGADLGADDWLRIDAAEVQRRAISNAALSHGGVLILHDTRAHTAEVLSNLITALEERGYRFVQLVPAPGAGERAATAPGALIGLWPVASSDPIVPVVSRSR
jgi:peptidoglycan/xylan/chitin deacetylase (PgdA/CDA1 family)